MDFSNCICIVNGVADGGGDQFPMAILVPVEICEQCFMFLKFFFNYLIIFI